MTKICVIKFEIEDLHITMDEAITIQVFNFLDSFFTQFLDILCYKTREKTVLPTFENLAKSWKDKELQIKNQDKAMANYAKQFTKKKTKLLSN